MAKKLLVKFELCCGRQGVIESVFITTEDIFKNLINQNMLFYEVLGKHSQVEHRTKEEDFTIVTNDQNKISDMESMFGLHISGTELSEYFIID